MNSNNFPRTNRHKMSTRKTGGLCLFINNKLTEGILIMKHHGDILVWLKLDKDFFGLANELFIANVNVVPENPFVS